MSNLDPAIRRRIVKRLVSIKAQNKLAKAVGPASKPIEEDTYLRVRDDGTGYDVEPATDILRGKRGLIPKTTVPYRPGRMSKPAVYRNGLWVEE